MSCPNVVRARRAEQADALEKRYRAAFKAARTNGTESTLKSLEAHIHDSKAILVCRLTKLMRLVGESDIFSNYYDLESLQFLSRNNVDDSPDWATLRPQAEIEVLGNAKHFTKLHYACLTINGESLPHYGECSIVLSEHMTAHRCSVFQENSALLFHRILESGTPKTRGRKSKKQKPRPGFPPGITSAWQNRAKLGVAKLAEKVDSSTQSAQFPELLLKAGASGIDDEFMEVHVFGDMTIRTFESVTLSKRNQTAPKGKRKRVRKRRGTEGELKIRDLCRRNNVPCEII